MTTEKVKLKVPDNEEEEEEDKDETKKKKKKKKKKSKVEEEEEEVEAKESSEDKADKKKKKSKVDSDEKTKDNEKIEKKASDKSKIESTVPSTDVEKAQIKHIEDPMKDKTRMKILKKVISHLCLLVLILGIMNVFLGLCAYFFYENKTHLVLFGALCIMQLIGSPVGWVAIQMGNRLLFLVCVIINLVWIISVVILMLYYWLINKSQSFHQEIALHVGAIFFMSASITLAVSCFLMMKRLDMINIQYKKPEIHISAEGKASEKAKHKE